MWSSFKGISICKDHDNISSGLLREYLKNVWVGLLGYKRRMRTAYLDDQHCQIKYSKNMLNNRISMNLNNIKK